MKLSIIVIIFVCYYGPLYVIANVNGTVDVSKLTAEYQVIIFFLIIESTFSFCLLFLSFQFKRENFD